MRHKRSAALSQADFVLLAGVPADFRLDYGRHINSHAFFVTANLCPITLAKNNDMRRYDNSEKRKAGQKCVVALHMAH